MIELVLVPGATQLFEEPGALEPVAAAPAKDGNLEEVDDIAHPEGRMHAGEMTRDCLPRTQESVGGARHAIEPCARLEHGRVSHAYDELVLVAAPHFLGLMRSTIGHQVSKLPVKSIGKGITRSTPEAIRRVVDDKR